MLISRHFFKAIFKALFKAIFKVLFKLGRFQLFGLCGVPTTSGGEGE